MSRTVTIQATEHPFRCKISNGVHTWYADEPVDHEGLDTGPSPTDLLLSAVGTCATITLWMYIKRKGWSVQNIELSLRIEEIKTENGTLHRIVEHLETQGEVTEEQHLRLVSILPKCPVAKIVTGQVEIGTE